MLPLISHIFISQKLPKLLQSKENPPTLKMIDLQF